jgi:plasmid stabilization system protein ParE
VRKRIRRHRAVADDIVEQARYIARDSVQAALRFWESCEQTLRWLLRHPGAGHLREFDDPSLAAIRSWPVRGFRNHLILYEVEETGIYILTITHGARDLPPILLRRRE